MGLTLILSTNAYRLQDEVTGEIREGVTLQIADQPSTTSRQKGLAVSKITAPIEALPNLATVPGYYDVEYSIRPGAGGKARVEYRSAKFIAPLELDFAQ
ncbi:hypothetical protein SAMN05880570_2642 [Paenibacillus sp. RU4T]|uniref:hypothetical protein n=1 Tax=unclassified Paenibacillus TaxID=185978 RepID=UPI0009547E8B|nr:MULTISPECIES: hypothetical protein [unclassified Paenibacillus]SIQ89560.1 hypothetical protein SAMN05880555_2642 [Paenibacillus sp. RU4X]SIR10442.1 hypothetical protein SAMN05880570_2642 [Paenibacillus sp. RU4T]